MSKTNEYPMSCGIDVSKASLDIHLLPQEESWQVSNTPASHQELVKRLQALPSPVVVVVEATGGLERPLVAALVAGAIAVIVVNPRQARRFAESLSANPCKTDPADAKVLALMGKSLPLELRPVADRAQQELAELVNRRRQLVEMLGCEKMRLAQATVHQVRQDVRATIDWLSARLRDLDGELQRRIDQMEELRCKSEMLQQEKGVGPTTARILVACLPELGRLDGQQITCLAGLAPLARDSGSSQAPRHIRGGRTEVRSALWMAAFTARRCNEKIQTFYERLIKAGKPYKVAMTACMRKLLTILNAVIRRQYRRSSPCTSS